MERKVITGNELLRILNEELAKYPECKGCKFLHEPVKLATPDKDECNWDATMMNVGCQSGQSRSCGSFSKKVVAEARSKYNIAGGKENGGSA